MEIENTRYDANSVNDSGHRDVRLNPADFIYIYTCTDYIANRRSFACWGLLKPKQALISLCLFLLVVAAGAPLLSGGRRDRVFWSKRWFSSCLSCCCLHDQLMGEPAEKSNRTASFCDLCGLQYCDFVYVRHPLSSHDDAYEGLAGGFP